MTEISIKKIVNKNNGVVFGRVLICQLGVLFLIYIGFIIGRYYFTRLFYILLVLCVICFDCSVEV